MYTIPIILIMSSGILVVLMLLAWIESELTVEKKPKGKLTR